MYQYMNAVGTISGAVNYFDNSSKNVANACTLVLYTFSKGYSCSMPVSGYGAVAEMMRYLTNGSKISVIGRLANKKNENYTLHVVADMVLLLKDKEIDTIIDNRRKIRYGD